MGATLVELRVRNLGVIEDVTVEVLSGMTALTGETGAGKTLLVDALGLLLGGRGDPSVVRAGADEAMVEGRFLLPPGWLPPGSSDGSDGTPSAGTSGGLEELILARSVARAGRSRAWIDGRMASLGALAEVASSLVELHGQSQHRTLVTAGAQRRALDGFAGIDVGPLEEARRHLRTLIDERIALGGDARERARRMDLLDFEISEVERARIEDTDEESRLEREEECLSDAEALRQAAADAVAALSGEEVGSALDSLGEAARSLQGKEPLRALHGRIRAAMADISDTAAELRAVVETWEEDPERLAEVRARRQLLRELERKYGDDLADVLAFAAEARQQRDALEADERRAVAIDDEIQKAGVVLEEAEVAVAAARREAAPRLAAVIEATLRRLAMPSARLAVAVAGEGAADEVTFLLGANLGEPLQPLAKVASGGELARAMLAVRLSVTGSSGVMVFDEVDAGVGGAAALSVGEALARLGETAQVLVVTHLAQVAAQASNQIAVRKLERDGRTVSDVTALDDQARVVELSRMLSGRPESASARRHARELLAGVPTGRGG